MTRHLLTLHQEVDIDPATYRMHQGRQETLSRLDVALVVPPVALLLDHHYRTLFITISI